MVSDALKTAAAIERKAHIPESDRTEERDNAADWIEEHIVEEDRYAQVTMKEMADESGWSRQHIANTLEAYFRPAGGATAGDGLLSELAGPPDADSIPESYSQGFKDGVAFALENWRLLRELSRELD